MGDEIIKTKVGETTFSQEVINAYEGYIWNVNEAIRFIEMGSGGFELLDVLKEIIKKHEEELWDKISKTFSK